MRSYYLQFEEQQTQSLIDQRIKEHLGQAAAFQQVGVAFNPMMGQRPSLPILPSPRLPIPGNASVLGGQPLFPGMRPLLPRPGPVQGRYHLYHFSAHFIEAFASRILHVDIVCYFILFTSNVIMIMLMVHCKLFDWIPFSWKFQFPSVHLIVWLYYF